MQANYDKVQDQYSDREITGRRPAPARPSISFGGDSCHGCRHVIDVVPLAVTSYCSVLEIDI